MKAIWKTTPLLAAVLVAVSLIYWPLRFAQGRLTASIQEQAVQRSFPVNGLKVRFDIGIEDGAMMLRGSAGRKLLLVASDDCPALPAALSIWKRMIADLPFRDSDSVLLVTRGGRVAAEIKAAATAAHVTLIVLRKDTSAAWAATTGISTTPSTLTLDRDQRVRLVGQLLDDRELQMFREFFSSSVP